ncbi:unnamed protein product [Jaminaea pallidilutea]
MSDNTGSKGDNQEGSFTIQPHPATTNDPATDPALQGKASHADPSGKPGPVVADLSNLEAKGKDELKARSEELNK